MATGKEKPELDLEGLETGDMMVGATRVTYAVLKFSDYTPKVQEILREIEFRGLAMASREIASAVVEHVDTPALVCAVCFFEVNADGEGAKFVMQHPNGVSEGERLLRDRCHAQWWYIALVPAQLTAEQEVISND